MIKELLTGALTSTLLLSAEPSNALTAQPVQMQNFMCNNNHKICEITQNACSYIDADGDGICDNYGTQAGSGSGNGYGGGNYVDADGDGICDNYSNQTGSGSGNGYGGHHGGGHHGGRCR